MFAAAIVAATLLSAAPRQVHADDPAVADASVSDAPLEEDIDATRLDVERLPPEAIEITRDLYAHGLFVEGRVGGRYFLGGAGRLSLPGPLFTTMVGYEIFPLLHVLLGAEGSIHSTNAPAPPSNGTFQVLGGLAEVRLNINIGARFAIWLGGALGVSIATSDLLRTYGVRQAGDVSLNYGGRIGFDWHFPNRHYSMGLSGGGRLFPQLEGFDGEAAIAIDAELYLRYVI
jgi:hypothetical protein